MLSINIHQMHRLSKDIKKNNEKVLLHCHMLLANTCWDNALAIIKLLIIWRCRNRRTNISYIAENNSVEAVKDCRNVASFLIFDVYEGWLKQSDYSHLIRWLYMNVLCKRIVCIYVFVQIQNAQSGSSGKSFWGQRESKLGEDICAALQLIRTCVIYCFPYGPNTGWTIWDALFSSPWLSVDPGIALFPLLLIPTLCAIAHIYNPCSRLLLSV